MLRVATFLPSPTAQPLPSCACSMALIKRRPLEIVQLSRHAIPSTHALAAHRHILVLWFLPQDLIKLGVPGVLRMQDALNARELVTLAPQAAPVGRGRLDTITVPTTSSQR